MTKYWGTSVFFGPLSFLFLIRLKQRWREQHCYYQKLGKEVADQIFKKINLQVLELLEH